MCVCERKYFKVKFINSLSPIIKIKIGAKKSNSRNKQITVLIFTIKVLCTAKIIYITAAASLCH